jgi:hypothetical protein
LRRNRSLKADSQAKLATQPDPFSAWAKKKVAGTSHRVLGKFLLPLNTRIYSKMYVALEHSKHLLLLQLKEFKDPFGFDVSKHAL